MSLVNQSTPGLVGYAPVTQQASDFQSGELRGLSGGVAYKNLTPNAVELHVPANLPRRKLYAWIYATNTNSNDFWAQCTWKVFVNNTPVGKLPLSVANNTAGTNPAQSSMPTLFITGGQSIQDCLGIYVTNPVNGQPSNVILQPLYIYGIFDDVQISVDSLRNVTDLRIFIACLSSQ